MVSRFLLVFLVRLGVVCNDSFLLVVAFRLSLKAFFVREVNF